MNLKAFSLLESLVALSILAFVTAASVYQGGKLYGASQVNIGQVYSSVKTLENECSREPIVVDFQSYSVERRFSKYSSQLDICTITATHVTGRELLQIRKLLPHETR